MQRIGAKSGTVGFNCFYQNQTNFAGYPGSYGQIVFNNRNGTASDIAFNIFEDPWFDKGSALQLADGSPCIDAGTSDWAYTDTCFPPSRGSSYTDLGAYGGPDACNWLDNVPILPVRAWMTLTNGVPWINWAAIPRCAYQVEWVTNLVSAGTNKWLSSSGGRVVADQKLFSGWLNTTNVPQAHCRIESLGRPWVW